MQSSCGRHQLDCQTASATSAADRKGQAEGENMYKGCDASAQPT
jgi:hypothetical protein